MGTRMIRKSFYLQRRASDKGRLSQLLPLVAASPMRHAHRQLQYHEDNPSPEASYHPFQTAYAQQLTPWRAALLQPSHPCEGGTRPSGCSSQTVAGKQTLQLRFKCPPACLTYIHEPFPWGEHGPAPASAAQHSVLSLQSPENSPPPAQSWGALQKHLGSLCLWLAARIPSRSPCLDLLGTNDPPGVGYTGPQSLLGV